MGLDDGRSSERSEWIENGHGQHCFTPVAFLESIGVQTDSTTTKTSIFTQTEHPVHPESENAPLFCVSKLPSPSIPRFEKSARLGDGLKDPSLYTVLSTIESFRPWNTFNDTWYYSKRPENAKTNGFQPRVLGTHEIAHFGAFLQDIQYHATPSTIYIPPQQSNCSNELPHHQTIPFFITSHRSHFRNFH
jgi:hypothetical protein